jgi:hypothetical protein
MSGEGGVGQGGGGGGERERFIGHLYIYNIYDMFF